MKKLPKLKRMGWRLGRGIYMRARGEERFGDIERNGEAHLQKCVIDNGPSDSQLVVFDIGANQGEWTSSFLSACTGTLSPERLMLHAFEPVPATAAMFRSRIDGLTGSFDVQLHELAMSDKPGHSEIGVFADGAGTNSLYHAADPRHAKSIINIRLTA